MPGIHRITLAALSMLPSLLALSAVVSFSVASANGRVVNFEKQQAGPYEVAVGTIPGSPIVGALHLTMTIVDLEEGFLLTDADVEVIGTGPESVEPDIGPVRAEPGLTSPGFYDVNTSVDRAGAWTIRVTVSDDKGVGSADFEITVREPDPLGGIAGLFAILFLLAASGWGVRVFLRQRKRQRADGSD